jgi:hypothetical protein
MTDRLRRLSQNEAAQLGARLTDRDKRIAFDCFEHRVLTTEQLRRLHFDGERTARARLKQLHGWRVLDRFRPARPHGAGTAPYHWVLDEVGALVVAAQLDLEPKELRWRRQAAVALAGSSKLRHQVAVNDFVSSLAEEARLRGGSLREWWGERQTGEALGGYVLPDGYGRLELPELGEVALLLELDRGSEDYGRLRDKARRYAKALARSELADDEPIVVLVVENPTRAAGARSALAGTAVPIAPVLWTPGKPALDAVRAAVAATTGRPNYAREVQAG